MGSYSSVCSLCSWGTNSLGVLMVLVVHSLLGFLVSQGFSWFFLFIVFMGFWFFRDAHGSGCS